MQEKPLVSVCIPNYNYGQYLRHCLDGVLAQTYENIELIVQDNASPDDSYDILREYEELSRSGKVRMFINPARNKRNIGSDGNVWRAFKRSEGKYVIYLSSDDAIKPDMISRCVEIMEDYPSVGMTMVHRDEIDENDVLYTTTPFYDRTFVAPGDAQAAVFMMAGIAVPSQTLFRTSVMNDSLRYHFYQFQVAGDWYTNFCLALTADCAYIHEALCEYRVHTGNETNESEKRLLNSFEHYVLVNAMNTTAETLGLTACSDRYTKAVEKLGDMCLRYSLKMTKNNLFDIASRYLRLAPVFKESVLDDPRYGRLQEIIAAGGTERADGLIKSFDAEYSLDRTISYEPPDGFTEVRFD